MMIPVLASAAVEDLLYQGQHEAAQRNSTITHSADPYLTAAILFAAVVLGVYLLVAAFKKVKS